MNCENVCGYLCFCCADAVDCGAASPRCMIFTLTPVSGTGTGFAPLPSREMGFCRLCWPCCCRALWFPAYAGMTGRGLVLACAPAHPPPLWIADQVRNDVTMLMHRFHPLFPVSGTGTGFGPLPSRERGILVGVVLLLPCPVDTALKPV